MPRKRHPERPRAGSAHGPTYHSREGLMPLTIRKRERRKNRLGNPLHARASALRKAWARNATRIRKEDVKPPTSMEGYAASHLCDKTDKTRLTSKEVNRARTQA